MRQARGRSLIVTFAAIVAVVVTMAASDGRAVVGRLTADGGADQSSRQSASTNDLAPAPAGPWDAFNYSPASRTVQPVAVFTTSGTVQNPAAVLSGSPTGLVGTGSSLTLDFGKEVGGFVTLRFGTFNATVRGVGLTFTESSLDVSTQHSDNSNGLTNIEPVITHYAPSGGTISTASTDGWSGVGSSAPGSLLRGGFRYLTIVNEGTGSLVLTGVSVGFSPAPGLEDPSAYPNYFYSNDALINRVWYAGAYTVQMDTISADAGRANPVPPAGAPPLIGWDNSALAGAAGTSILVDGAKRDRSVWPGDMGMQIPTDLASLGDWQTVKNSLQLMYDLEQPSGQLPYSGPVLSFYGSDSYHMWTLVSSALYYKISGDRAWLDANWSKYKAAVAFVTNKIGADHLFNGTANGDWARTDAGGRNIELESLCYRVLTQSAALARVENDADPAAAAWAQQAADLKDAVNSGGFWDPDRSLYRDKTSGNGANLYPQDGNSLAAWFGLATPDRARGISGALTSNWTSIGAKTPEKSATSIHPFPGSMEVQAHFAANDDQRGLDLIRAEWGYMLDAPQGTASTFWEGYKTDGSSDYTDTGPGFRPGAYMSMAHGWATGPTSALTFYVLGIDPGPVDESTYDLVPHPGDLHHVEGQLDTAGGPVRLAYDVDQDAGTFTARYTASDGVLQTISLPTYSSAFIVQLDGDVVWDGTRATGSANARIEDGRVLLDAVGGTHTVSVEPLTFSTAEALVAQFSTSADVTSGLNDKLVAAAQASSIQARANLLDAFENEVQAQSGKALTTEQAQILLDLAVQLK